MTKTWLFPYDYFSASSADNKRFKKGNTLSWILSTNPEFDHFKEIEIKNNPGNSERIDLGNDNIYHIQHFDKSNQEYTGSIEIGAEVYFWSHLKEEEIGIFGIGLVSEKPSVFPFKSGYREVVRDEDYGVFPEWARKYQENIEPLFFDKCKLRREYYDHRFRVGIKISKLFVESDFLNIKKFNNNWLFNSLNKLALSGNEHQTHYLLSEDQAKILKVLSNEEGSLKKSSEGQGYSQDPLFNQAVELHAVEMAKAHFEKKGFKVIETGNYESYDLSCVKEGLERRVEVKGTTTEGATITLTRGEIEHVRAKITPVDLVLVSKIIVNQSDDGPKASEGNFRIIENWMPLDEDLTIKTYDYKIP